MKKTKKKTESPPKLTKTEKLFENLLKTTEQFLSGKGYAALSETELVHRLSIPIQHTPLFRQVLDTLVKRGIIELSKNRYILKTSRDDVVSGIIRMHPRGFGFVQTEDSIRYPQDIFIPKHLTQNAVDGDIVEVLVNMEAVSEKGPEGKVLAILERGRSHIGGIIRQVEPGGDILAYVPLLGTNQRVVVQPNPEFKLREGDRLVMEVVDWGSKDSETICKVSHYIGHISDPSCDIKAAIEEFEIRADFPSKVIDEAESFGKQVSLKEIKNREDLRDLEIFTIDPDTAKDFDDAINISKDKKGNYHLGVHIADVSHYVMAGSALDEEASQRCNSTYFPGVCIPMLPGELSNNLCSLKPNVNRLTVSVFMDFDAHGTLTNYRIARTLIKSAKRFTYKEAKLVLDGKKKSPHLPALKLMVELCGLLKRKRYERGSLEFAIPELVVLVDDKGVPTGTDYIEYDITHQLVEEFMLKANEMVATHLTKKGKGLTFRIHDVPADENMRDFSILAGAFGFNLSEVPTPKELQDLFEEAKTTPYGEYLATSYIRRMRLAIYSGDNIGHYGLGLEYYCHFTSPIRRYVDLVVHRILFGEDMASDAIDQISDKCSEQERISAKAEGSVVLLKKLRLLQQLHDENPNKEFEAVVTKVKNFGVYFEVLELMLESFFHISELEDDYYVYDEAKSLLRGKRTGSAFCAGDKITVMLKELDFITRESSWYLVDVANKPKEEKSRPRRKSKETAKRGPFKPARNAPKAAKKRFSKKPKPHKKSKKR